MEIKLAPLALSIKILTGAVILMTMALLVGISLHLELLIPAAIFLFIALFCYLRAPVAYVVSGDRLIVRLRAGKKNFGPILGARPADEVGFTIRLWGNGGVFAVTGIFWNRKWGMFRAYLSTTRPAHLMLIETRTGKVLISPAGPEAILKALNRDLKVSPPAAFGQ